MRKPRAARGSAIMETGPALFVLFVLILFPLFDVLAIGIQFTCAWYLNHEATRECAVSKWDNNNADWPTALNQVKTAFWKTGIPEFAHVINGSHSYTATPASAQSPAANGAVVPTATVMTKVTCKPFLYIPVPGIQIDGVNKDLTVSFTSEKEWETYNANDPNRLTGPSNGSVSF